MSLNIDLGTGYVITSDPMNFVLNEVKVYKTGKNIGASYLVPVGFYPSIDSLVNALLTKHVLASERNLTGLKELQVLLLALQANLVKTIKEFIA